MLRRDMLRLDVLEQLMNMQVLLIGLGVVTYTKDHDVELVQIFGVLYLVEE